MIIDTNNLTEESFSKIKTIVRVAGESYWGSPAVKESKLNEAIAKGLNFSGYNTLSARMKKSNTHSVDETTPFSVREAVSQCNCLHCDVELDVEKVDERSSKLSCSECELTLFTTVEGNKTHILIAWSPNELSGTDEAVWLAFNTENDENGTVSSVYEPSYNHPWFIAFTEKLIKTGKPLFLSNDQLNQDEMVLSVIKQSHDIDTPDQVEELIRDFKEEGLGYVYCCPDSGVTMYSENPASEDEPNYSAVVTIEGFESVSDPRPVARPLFGWAMTECGLHEPR